MITDSTDQLLKDWDRKSALEALEILCKARHVHTLKELLFEEKEVERYLRRHPLIPDQYKNQH